MRADEGNLGFNFAASVPLGFCMMDGNSFCVLWFALIYCNICCVRHGDASSWDLFYFNLFMLSTWARTRMRFSWNATRQEQVKTESSRMRGAVFRQMRETTVSTCPPRGNLVDGLPRAPTLFLFRESCTGEMVFSWPRKVENLMKIEVFRKVLGYSHEASRLC